VNEAVESPRHACARSSDLHASSAGIVGDGQEHILRDTYAQVADRFQLTEADRQELTPSGTQSLLHNRVGWAKTYLVKAGLLRSPRRGVILITDRGRQALAGNQRIDNKYLRQFIEFIEFIRGAVDVEGAEPGQQPATSVPPAVETTPEELIETGYRQVQTALASDLLERFNLRVPRPRSSSAWL